MLNKDGSITLMPGSDVFLNWTAKDAKAYTDQTIKDFEKLIADEEAKLETMKNQLANYKALVKKVTEMYEKKDAKKAAPKKATKKK